MQNEIRKTQNVQIPSMQGRAVESENRFHHTINKFYESDHESGHIKFLTELCRAFTGISFDQKVNTMDISNGVFSVNQIKDFIIGVENAYLSKEPWMSVEEATLLGEFLDPMGSETAIEVLNDSIMMWIHPGEPEHTIEYLSHSLDVFRNITELIRICNKINNHYLFTMEGGAEC